MKNILLLTDFSSNSENAIHYALELLGNTPCNLYLVHVQKAGFSVEQLIDSSSANVEQLMIYKSKSDLDSLLNNIIDKYSNKKHNIQALLYYDTFIGAVNACIKSYDIDLLVTGSNGVTGAREVIFGSHAQQLIRSANCTTLVIPEDYNFSPISNVLIPLEHNEQLKSASFTNLVGWSSDINSHLTVIRIFENDENKEITQSDRRSLAILNATYTVICNVSLKQAVQTYIQVHTIDALAIVQPTQNIFERIFLSESSASKISSSLRIPLLISR